MAAISSLLSSTFQIGTGITQSIRANQMRKEAEYLMENRATFTTPDEAFNVLGLMSQAFADPRMAGQSRLEDLTGLAQANTLEAGRQSGNPFAVLSASQGQADVTQQDIQMRAAQMNEQDRDRLAQALQMIAGYKDQEWQINEFAPWRDKYQYALNEYRDNLQGGNRNIMSGIDATGSTMTGLAMMGAGGGQQIDLNALMQILQKYSGGASQQPMVAPPGVGDFFYSSDTSSTG